MNNVIEYIKEQINNTIDIAVVTGSGLSNLKTILNNPIVIPYSSIPNYFTTTVKGHEGAFYFGKFKKKNILIAVGRFHFYEGLSFEDVGLPIKIFHSLGCKKIILTNSSGCLQSNWTLGDIMIVNGHYDFTFRNSSENPKLICGKKYYNDILIKEVLNLAPNIKVGTYGWVLGPMYETKAEINNMQHHGVNAVGMSTIPEVIMASQLNIDTLVLCLMSNYAVGLTNDALNHQTVLINSIKHNENFKLLLTSILTKI